MMPKLGVLATAVVALALAGCTTSAAPSAIATSGAAASSPTKGLESVSCVTAKDCWAVGGTNMHAKGQPLITHWNGKYWTTTKSPAVSTSSALKSVSCATASDCWAVGVGGRATLYEHWNGSAWLVVPTPNSLKGQPIGERDVRS